MYKHTHLHRYTTCFSSDTHFASLNSHKHWTKCSSPTVHHFKSVGKAEPNIFPFQAWKVHRAYLFTVLLKNPMVIWRYFFIPLRCLSFLFFNSFLFFHHLSPLGQDWTKTNSREACLCFPGRTDRDEQARMFSWPDRWMSPSGFWFTSYLWHQFDVWQRSPA